MLFVIKPCTQISEIYCPHSVSSAGLVGRALAVIQLGEKKINHAFADFDYNTQYYELVIVRAYYAAQSLRSTGCEGFQCSQGETRLSPAIEPVRGGATVLGL
jgi:hypothetical protein